MSDYSNPFEYKGASKLSINEIIDYYIPDHNFSRFIKTKRNIFLVGERGTGKTMTLKYNSFPIKFEESKRPNKPDIDFRIVGIYVPCNTPMSFKKDYELLDEFLGAALSDHSLVLSIMQALIDTVNHDKSLLEGANQKKIKEFIEYTLIRDLPNHDNVIEATSLMLQREYAQTQIAINDRNPNAFYEKLFSFSSGIIPLIKAIKMIPVFKSTHFSFMLDDLQQLNEQQLKTFNSWISFRENTFFSFKAASVKVNQPNLITSAGGIILEGHDYSVVDMERPYQNKYSDFGKLSRKIISKRLKTFEIFVNPEDYFPTSEKVIRDLQVCKKKVREEALTKYSENEKAKISNYISKYTRARYFQERSPKANRPIYSGLDILVHLSTGVIRFLLEPCFWMYDLIYSEKGDKVPITVIPPKIQNQIIIDHSERKWDFIRKGLNFNSENCSAFQAKAIYNLFNQLAIYFRYRLLNNKSEPRAISFTISGEKFEKTDEILELIDIARQSSLIFTHSSSAKNLGQREIYYVPNRIFWPVRGLDPHGQHARASIKAKDLWNAAFKNFKIGDQIDVSQNQRGIFDE